MMTKISEERVEAATDAVIAALDKFTDPVDFYIREEVSARITKTEGIDALFAAEETRDLRRESYAIIARAALSAADAVKAEPVETTNDERVEAALEAAWLAHDNACPGEHWRKRARMEVAIKAYLSALSAADAVKAEPVAWMWEEEVDPTGQVIIGKTIQRFATHVSTPPTYATVTPLYASPPTSELEALRKERDILNANLVARAKTLLRLRDVLTQVHDHIEDEGDRVYFGSTNDAETLKDVWRELDGWSWDDIMSDGKLTDIFEISRKAHVRAETAEANLAEVMKALEPFAIRAGMLDGKWLDHETHWSPAYGSTEITIGDLRTALRVREGGKA